MTIKTRTLIQIAAWGGLIVSSTGLYLQTLLVDKIRALDHYKTALKLLRSNAGAVYYLGEPIKDKRLKLSDTDNNSSGDQFCKFRIPVSGPKDKGAYYYFAERNADQWKITKAELEIKSIPDSKLIIFKENFENK